MYEVVMNFFWRQAFAAICMVCSSTCLLYSNSPDLLHQSNTAPISPKIKQKGTVFIVSDIDICEISSKERKALKQLYVDLGICKSITDVKISKKNQLIKIHSKHSCRFQNRHNHIVMKAIGTSSKECTRKCETAQVSADILCSGFAAKWGAKGLIPAAACAAGVQILAYQCEDCCIEGFANCEKKMEEMMKDLLNTTFPPDSSILD